MNAAVQPETVIVGAEISAGHDGAAKQTSIINTSPSHRDAE